MAETASITVPLQVWGRLVTEADHRGVKVEDLVVDSIAIALGRRAPEVGFERSTLQHDRGDTIATRIEQMVRDGIPDPVIAHRLQSNVETVRTCRRAAHLMPARFRRNDWPELIEPHGQNGTNQ